MNKYEIIIHWSDEDQAFLADVPELPGCMAHGDTYESALANIKSAMDLWIKTAKELYIFTGARSVSLNARLPPRPCRAFAL